MCKYDVFVAKICKHALFVVKICKHVFFVAKFCNRALDERFCWTFCGAQKAANFCHPAATSRITTAFLLLLESSYLINAMLRWKTTYSGTPFLYFYFRRWVLSYFTSAIVIWMIVRSLYWHCWNKYMQARHKNGSLGGVNVKMRKSDSTKDAVSRW